MDRTLEMTVLAFVAMVNQAIADAAPRRCGDFNRPDQA
jgi:hypothetical protein